MDHIIAVENVSKSFKGFQLNNLSFSVKKGFITGFIGPNGAGKTSTIKLIMNLLAKDSGNIKIFGLDHVKNEKEIKERIGFVYADNHYYEHLTVQQIKKVIAPFYKSWDDPAFEHYIERFELPKNKKIKHLSKGMKMKLSLALALSHNAELILMDEPTSGLDPVFRNEILDILGEIMLNENKTIFFSTHITSDLEKIADYILFINKGKMVFSENKDDILNKYRIVKGGKELLDNDTRKMFVGLRETALGFEGLAFYSEQMEQDFQNVAFLEIPSLEEIMVYTVKGGSAR